jgi:hypothetical protein
LRFRQSGGKCMMAGHSGKGGLFSRRFTIFDLRFTK